MAPDPMLPRRYRVTEAWPELEGVATMTLAPVEGETHPFLAGQFNMLYAFGVGELAVSISGDPGDPDRLVHTTRAVGAVSSAITRLRPGDMLGVRGPFGTGWPVMAQGGRHLLFVAGGLGLAPLRPAILQALAARAHFAGLSLLIGARSPADILYPLQIAEWAAGGAIALRTTVDHASRGWTGRVGVVTTAIVEALKGRDPAMVSALVCGPEVMMRYTAQALEAEGVPGDRIFLSMERNMKCATGFCGHCQYGPDFVCRDGPVFPYADLARRLGVREY